MYCTCIMYHQVTPVVRGSEESVFRPPLWSSSSTLQRMHELLASLLQVGSQTWCCTHLDCCLIATLFRGDLLLRQDRELRPRITRSQQHCKGAIRWRGHQGSYRLRKNIHARCDTQTGFHLTWCALDHCWS